jgi:hypothetical protein
MDGKMEQRVCIKFCVKLGKSTTETLEMLCETFGEHSLSWTVVFEWCSRFKGSPVQLMMANIQGSQIPMKRDKMLKTFENLSTKTIAEHYQTLERKCRKRLELCCNYSWLLRHDNASAHRVCN